MKTQLKKYSPKIKFLLILISLISTRTVHAQYPGCPNVDAGPDQTISCNNTATLTAIPLATGSTTAYTVTSIPYVPPFSYSAGTEVSAGADDEWFVNETLPFNFCFFGTYYNHIVIGANGLVSFNTALTNGTCPWSYTESCPDPNIVGTDVGPFIFGPYHDIDPSIAGGTLKGVRVSVIGTYPCRTYVVNYNEIAMYNCTSLFATHQIVLYEATNVIEVYIKSAPACASWNSGNKCIGIQNAAGTVGYTPPGRNTGAWSTTNEAWRFTPSGPANYTVSWSLGATTIANTAVTTVNPISTTTYTAHVLYTNCDGTQFTDQDDVIINVNNTLTPVITPNNATVCSGSPVSLTANAGPGCTYSWSTGTTPATGATVSVSPTITSTYTVSATNGSCAGNSTVEVTINSSSPLPTITTPVNYCLNQSASALTATAATGGSLNWYGTIATGGSASSTAPTPSTLVAGVFNYYVSQTISGCESPRAQIVVNVNALPTANAGADKTITCTNSTVVLDGSLSSSGAGITYAWSGPGITANGTTNSPTVNAAGTYILTVTNSDGCQATDNVAVTSNTTPPTANAGADKTITCTNPSVVLDGTGSSSGAGITYGWSGTIVSGGTTNSPTVNAANTYTLTVTNTNNGCQATNDVLVTTDITPPIANAGPDKTINCSSTTVVLDGSGSSSGAGITYGWSGTIFSGGTTNSPSVNTANTYIITVTNSSNGCLATDNVTVTSDGTAPIANAGSDKTITCTNTAVVLDGSGSSSGAGITYSWSGTIVSGGTTNSPTVNAANTYTLTVTNTNNGCQATNDVLVTTDIIPPTANAGADKTITCTNTSVVLDGTASSSGAGITYGWSGTIVSGGTTNSPTVNAANTYTITVTNTNNGCQATNDVLVTTDITPPIANAGADKTITCTNSSVVLDGTGSSSGTGITYGWSGTIVSDGTTNSPTVNAANTYTLTVINTVNGCQAVDNVLVTTNNTPPTATAGADFTISCIQNTSGGSIGTTNTTGFTYSWSPTTDLDNANISNPTANPGTTTNYVLTLVETLTGCSNIDNVTVTVDKSLPIADAGADQTIDCSTGVSGVQIGVASVVGVTYSWFPSTNLTSDIASNPMANPTISTNYVITTTKTSSGCTATDPMDITVDKVLPTANAGADLTITCLNPTATLNGSASSTGANISYSWSGTVVSGGNTNSPSINSAGTYTITVLNGTNHCSAQDNVTVSNSSTPPTAVTSGNASICAGASTPITSSGATTFAWLPTTGLSAANISNPIANPTITTNYVLTITDGNGCTDSEALTITVNPIPTININPAAASICQGASQTLTASSNVSSTNFEWTGGSSVNPFIVTPATTDTIYVTGTANGCSNSSFSIITVNPNPIISYTADKISGCVPLEVQFNDPSTSETTWLWNFGDLSSSTNTSAIQNPIHTFDEAGQFDITLTVGDANGCTSTLTQNAMITTHALPSANFTNNPEVGTMENPIVTFNPYGTSPGVTMWNWNFGEPLSTNNTSSNQTPTHTFINAGDFEVILMVQTPFGCKDSIMKIVHVKEMFALFVPNAFTPDDDNKNDTFGPKGIGVDENNFEMNIYDRWGGLIYSTKDFNAQWDGKFKGKKCPQEVYNWIILAKEVDGPSHKYIGIVTLL